MARKAATWATEPATLIRERFSGSYRILWHCPRLFLPFLILFIPRAALERILGFYGVIQEGGSFSLGIFLVLNLWQIVEPMVQAVISAALAVGYSRGAPRFTEGIRRLPGSIGRLLALGILFFALTQGPVILILKSGFQHILGNWDSFSPLAALFIVAIITWAIVLLIVWFRFSLASSILVLQRRTIFVSLATSWSMTRGRF